MRISKRNKINPYLAVDPGLNGTGWTVFKSEHDPVFKGNGVIFEHANVDWEKRAMLITKKLLTIANSWEVNRVYIEYPAYFESAGGQMVARKGDLLKLTFLVGCIFGHFYPVPVVLVPVHTWKGQLPKEIVKRRIKQILGETKCKSLKSHDFDSTGIGLFVQGLL
jgi:hypothetical protein